MKALVLTEKNQPLSFQEAPYPKPLENEATVKLYAASLNHRDSWIQKGQYAGLKYPIILGSDGSGIVHETGSASDSRWIGQEVLIYPALDWGHEESHQDSQNFKILGLPEDGTFAEYVRIPISNLVLKPKYLSFEEAAALPLAGVTAFRAVIKKARLLKSEKILITGIGGGVALFALQFAKIAQAEIFVTSGDTAKIERAKGLGASNGVNYNNPDWAAELEALARSFDVIIDGAAGDGLDQLLNLVKPGGRIVLYGATKGNPSNITARRIFWKQLNILGSTMGSPADFLEMINLTSRENIKPVIDKIYSFEEGDLAMQRMRNSHQFGKIVISILRGRP
jgi:NADPH:quinone reductase-like Zn-dependent oxidoreductase